MALSPTPMLVAWLAANVPAVREPLDLVPFTGGQSNPTYAIGGAGARYVLRRKPDGSLLPSAHQIEREYRVLRALAGTGLPVPRAVALCEDPAVFGSPFFIMEFLDGRVINDPALPGIAPADRAAMYAAALDALAALHRVDYQAVGLADFGRPQGYLERQVARWTTQYRATQSGALPAMDALIAWLPRHVPPGDEAAIAHGDYRIGNLCFAPHAPAVIGILDWELATLGHPLLDLAYFLTAHAMPLDVLRQTGGSAELASVPGIPSIDEAIEHYCRAAGRERPANLRFFGALAFFRSAAIMQGIRHRIALGNAAGGAEAAQRAAAVPRLAELGWAMVEGSGC